MSMFITSNNQLSDTRYHVLTLINQLFLADLLAGEIVSTENDQEESDSEGENLPGDILQCDDQPQCSYYTRHSSIYETVETHLYVCNKCMTKKRIYNFIF